MSGKTTVVEKRGAAVPASSPAHAPAWQATPSPASERPAPSWLGLIRFEEPRPSPSETTPHSFPLSFSPLLGHAPSGSAAFPAPPPMDHAPAPPQPGPRPIWSCGGTGGGCRGAVRGGRGRGAVACAEGSSGRRAVAAGAQGPWEQWRCARGSRCCCCCWAHCRCWRCRGPRRMVRPLRVSPPAGRKRAGAACVSTSGVRVESPASAVGSAGVGELRLGRVSQFSGATCRSRLWLFCAWGRQARAVRVTC